MLTITNNSITEKDLYGVVDNSLLHILNKSKLLQEDVMVNLHTLAEKALWKIDVILKHINEIEEKDIRNWFRGKLISKRFGIDPYNQYEIVFVSDDCVLIRCPRRIYQDIYQDSVAVLTPQGDIKVQEGEVWINGNSLSPYGFTAWWNNKMGIYTKKGDVLFPCVFEHLSNPVALVPDGILQYKGFLYWYNIEFKEPTTDEPMIAFTCDDRIYSVRYVRYNNDGYIHNGGVSISRTEEDPFVMLPGNQKQQLAKQSIKELFEIIKSTHPNGIIKVFYDENEPVYIGC